MHTTLRFRLGICLLPLIVATAFAAAAADAQVPIEADPGSSFRSREDLEELLGYYEDALRSPAYSESVKESLAVQASRIRERLRDGDFKLGDRIVLSVEGETALPDTVLVEAGPRISLPIFGDIPLDGVLRSEVEERITQSLSAFLRNPIVRAEGLMRLSVQGSVAQPGFYVVPANMLLSETLMVAGGMTAGSDLDGIRLERGQEVLMEGDDLQEAIRQGLSLDQLNMQAGDQVVLPSGADGGFLTNLGVIAGLVSSVAFVVFQLSR